MSNKKRFNPLTRLKQWYTVFRLHHNKIKKKDYQVFLEKVNVAIVDLLHHVPEEDRLLKELRTEANRWLNNLPFLHEASFKAGVCTGIALYLQNKEKEAGGMKYVI